MFAKDLSIVEKLVTDIAKQTLVMMVLDDGIGLARVI